MRFQLLPIDRPTVNNRIYPRALVEKVIEDIEKSGKWIPVSRWPSDGYQDLTDTKCIVGQAKNFRIEDPNNTSPVTRGIVIDAPWVLTSELVLDHAGVEIELLTKDMAICRPWGVGEYGEDGVVTEWELKGVNWSIADAAVPAVTPPASDAPPSVP